MDKRMKNIILFRLKKSLQNEKGFVFSYVLVLTLILSAFLLHHMSEQYVQTEHLILSNEQRTIENLIQIAIHDFKDFISKEESVKDHVTFTYETGLVTIHFSLEEPETYRLHLEIVTNRGTLYTYKTSWMNKNTMSSP